MKRPAAPLALAAAAGTEPRTPGQPLALAILYKYMFIISVRTCHLNTHLVYWYKSLTTVQLYSQLKLDILCTSIQTPNISTDTSCAPHTVHHNERWVIEYLQSR